MCSFVINIWSIWTWDLWSCGDGRTLNGSFFLSKAGDMFANISTIKQECIKYAIFLKQKECVPERRLWGILYGGELGFCSF